MRQLNARNLKFNERFSNGFFGFQTWDALSEPAPSRVDICNDCGGLQFEKIGDKILALGGNHLVTMDISTPMRASLDQSVPLQPRGAGENRRADRPRRRTSQVPRAGQWVPLGAPGRRSRAGDRYC